MQKVLDLLHYLSDGKVLLRDEETPSRYEGNNDTLSTIISENSKHQNRKILEIVKFLYILAGRNNFFENRPDRPKNRGLRNF